MKNEKQKICFDNITKPTHYKDKLAQKIYWKKDDFIFYFCNINHQTAYNNIYFEFSGENARQIKTEIFFKCDFFSHSVHFNSDDNFKADFSIPYF